ncbi:hypothetical protein NDU88_000220 [Pleurodeles waltl]|uniref:Ig-like domain-containing protein n=1 Tax=Pleurodeles waltl TaxID=8319 RepID=A0AAV7NC36_PLEWA|nr:hypothetical protein NDU88_000220 [Pleurodeles waltl]
MAALGLLLVLLAGFGLPAGGETCSMVYAAPGGTALLPLSYSLALCTGDCNITWRKNTTECVAKISSKSKVPGCRSRPNSQMFTNGSLELARITPNDTGNYTLTASSESSSYGKCFLLHVQEPVSIPEVNYTCQPNASVQLSCSVENGTDPSYSWSLDNTPPWTTSKETVSNYPSVLRNVTCSVKNGVSQERSNPIDITCPDPVSEPEVDFRCRSRGMVQLFCRVSNGTDPSFSWIVNGKEEDNRTSSVEIPIKNEFLEVTCTARNQISERSSKGMNITCMDPVSEPEVVATCAPNLTVRLSCHLANGTEPSYSWSVNGTQQNISASGGELTIDAAVLFNVTCTARNQINQRESQPVNVSCIDPVSEPKVVATCAPNGTVRLSCHLVNGTEPSYSWSVNGTQQNISASGGELTIDAAVLFNVTCTAANLISKRESQPVNVSCIETWTAITTVITLSPGTRPNENSTTGRGRGSCISRYQCILYSALGGVGLLILTALPLVIGCFCTMPRETSL